MSLGGIISIITSLFILIIVGIILYYVLKDVACFKPIDLTNLHNGKKFSLQSLQDPNLWMTLDNTCGALNDSGVLGIRVKSITSDFAAHPPLQYCESLTFRAVGNLTGSTTGGAIAPISLYVSDTNFSGVSNDTRNNCFFREGSQVRTNQNDSDGPVTLWNYDPTTKTICTVTETDSNGKATEWSCLKLRSDGQKLISKGIVPESTSNLGSLDDNYKWQATEPLSEFTCPRCIKTD